MGDLVKHLACSNCRCTFNDNVRQPLSLMCGHIACKKCVSLAQPFTCLRDNKLEHRKADKIPVADLILEMLRSIETPQNYLCSLHSRAFEFFCTECSVPFCAKCVMTHRQHDYIEVEAADHLVQSIRGGCLEAISEAEAQYQTSKARLYEIQEARVVHQSNLKGALEELKVNFEILHEQLNSEYSQDEARLIRDSCPLKNYIDQHEEHQKLMLSVMEEEKRQAEKIRGDLMKCDSNIAVLAKLDYFSYKPQQLENFDFDFGLLHQGRG
mmetsp:Transcript_11106/g.21758  ORF Transcript_11106/g.21758 Transcript_11106/m.21758 type:complete len:268 (-) Transcript_11106:2916-3719(-)|eukprot:CAMPEP_0204910920 /NCGR_PEP_ID=MMETSP1397-20131031/9362_1 /ASSEMBLY_ACC=CAM_ASM_000891 /TAXON_ID=49980 /ORGANISM="Climacostomum Climacostomum virens, Strain Stock W-24" /LENGTH=267 /DNA_ID=CAMNT_0052081275 /DNA_START=639 /DNA_END=1445 /DNA_ORIENTATION=-